MLKSVVKTFFLLLYENHALAFIASLELEENLCLVSSHPKTTTRQDKLGFTVQCNELDLYYIVKREKCKFFVITYHIILRGLVGDFKQRKLSGKIKNFRKQ